MMQGIMFKMMMNVTKSCFVECVTSFKDGVLSSNEQSCIKACSMRTTDAMKSMSEI
jgi:hypothetical protein